MSSTLTSVYSEERGMWCPSTIARDNWVRLVAAVVKKEQIRQLCYQQSISTISSYDSTQPSLNFSVPPLPLQNPSLSRVENNASSEAIITGELYHGWFGRRESEDKDLVDIPEDIAIHLGQLQRFPIQELLVATDNFSSRNIFRRGNKYEGWLADGTPVSVERREMIAFQTEVEVMSSVAVHCNLLRPRGFCMSTKGRFLVYPYMHNGSVLSYLRGRHESEAALISWEIKKRIALGVAKGVAYLHEELGDIKIIHRNISSANIFLDEDFEAVVGDFSLAVLVEHNASYVGNTGRGTTGLITPEYVATGGVSEKSDVYGYGVFLLELISGQKASALAQLAKHEGLTLLDWVHRLYKEKKWEKIVGANVASNYIHDAVMKQVFSFGKRKKFIDEKSAMKQLLQIALLCTEIDPKKRPKMSEVVSMIED